jgi:hypothetical protein
MLHTQAEDSEGLSGNSKLQVSAKLDQSKIAERDLPMLTAKEEKR